MMVPRIFQRGSFLIGLCVVSTLLACVPAAISVSQLISVRKEIARIDRAASVAARAREVQGIVGHSLLSFLAIAVELSPEERGRVLKEADQEFLKLETSVEELLATAGEFTSDIMKDALATNIAAVARSWKDIREGPETGATATERAAHFLSIVKKVRDVRAILDSIENQAANQASVSTRDTFERVQTANVLLFFVIVTAALMSALAIHGNYRFAQGMRKANRTLRRKNREIRDRDRAITEQMDRFNVALENMSQGLCMFGPDERLVVCNSRYIDMYELPEHLGQPGTPFRDILANRIEQGIYVGDDPDAYLSERVAAVREKVRSTKLHRLTNGRIVAIAHRPMDNGGWVATHEDITEMQQVEAKIAHMALHDALTDLPNRVLLRERIIEALSRCSGDDSFAVLCLDLDRFKSVNDTLGHPVGDALLRQVADRLRACVGETDTVGRLGGDEFAITQTGGRQPSSVILLATRICAAIAEPFDLDGHQVAVSASIGIALAPADGTDPDQLLKNADMALYRAKGDGRGVYRFFETEMDARMQERRALELDMRKAIEQDQFTLHYQPLVDLTSGEISCFEALMRWPHPERGMVPPGEFVSIAEETGLIVALGEWVLRRACADAVHWPHRVRIAVNLSPVQFRSERLVDMVFGALARSGLAANRLELEITESVLLQDSDRTIGLLHRMRDMGVRIAMDDFGTGYSSLSYLRSFPFDKIKLDRSFVNDVETQEDAGAIIETVAKLAKSLGMTATAEGIETRAQMALVKAAGYTEMQGFLFSPALPADEIARRFFPDSDAEKARA